MNPGKKLNLGCGPRSIDGWVNCDFQSGDSRVVRHDLRRPLPFFDGQFQFVYHSHVLEHLQPGEAVRLLRECGRVLKPGGTLRVVVPDLEKKAKIYLQCLQEACQANDPGALARHQWMTIEMVDQHARERSGGEMVEFILSRREEAFVRKRLGDEYNHVLKHGKVAISQSSTAPHWSFRALIRNQVRAWAKKILDLSDRDLSFLQFERLGERHRWMYDRLSLGYLLKECGFKEITEMDAFRSRAPDWVDDGLWLDVENGEVRKPDSIYFEAVK